MSNFILRRNQKDPREAQILSNKVNSNYKQLATSDSLQQINCTLPSAYLIIKNTILRVMFCTCMKTECMYLYLYEDFTKAVKSTASFLQIRKNCQLTLL